MSNNYISIANYKAGKEAMEQALPIDEDLLNALPEDHDFGSGGVEELSAEEFLALVRREADRLPGVVRIDAPNSHPKTECMPRVPSIKNCPEEFLPDSAWVNDICASFSDAREALARRSLDTATRERRLAVPPMKSRRRWEVFCFGDDAGERALDQEAAKENEGEGEDENRGAISKDTLVQSGGVEDKAVELDSRKVQLMEWLQRSATAPKPDDEAGSDGESGSEEQDEEGDEEDETPLNMVVCEVEEGEVVGAGASVSAPEEPSNVAPSTQLMLQFDQVLTQRLLGYHIEWLEALKQLSRARCQWLYCLMARIEKPLSGEMASGMRQLYRVCSNARADLVRAVMESSSVSEAENRVAPKDLDDQAESELAMLNTIIAITGMYFGQGEEFAQLSET